MTGKRVFDILFSVIALILLSPIMLVAAVWIKRDSPGPAIYRQNRVGREGIPFAMFKFRTMDSEQADPGVLITKANDPRITKCGKVLRRTKIDELPQFVNVLLGQMSVVGPRPEVKKFVDLYPENLRQKILSVRPGITDNASIIYRNESDLLSAADDAEKEYVEAILPTKLALYEKYVDEQSLAGDFVLIVRTLASVIHR